MGNSRLVDLPINLIKIPEPYVRSKYDREKLELLKRSIKAQGQIEPIIVCQSDGEYYLVDGLHRLLALRELGYRMIKAVVHDCHDLSDALLKNLVANYIKRPHDSLSFLKVAKILLKRYGPRNLARWTGKSERYWWYINDVVTYLPEDLIKKAVEEYGANLTKLILAAQLVKSCGEACREELYSDKFWKMSTIEMRKYVVKRTLSNSVKVQEGVSKTRSNTMTGKLSKQDLLHLVANYLIKQLDELNCNMLASICGIESIKCDDVVLNEVKQEMKATLEAYLKPLK